MPKLIARRYLIHKNEEYFPEDVLPSEELGSEFVDELVANGGAVWKDEEPAAKPPKARRTTAQVGDYGINAVGAETKDTIPGTVPETEARKKAPAKKPRKKKVTGE